jgi:glycine/D-amino acid oxidase-like deaminating enzyme/nitrite reductase/ring-hydroxylating ferredoxin subunit
MSTTAKLNHARNEPIWTVTAQTPKYPPLKESTHADVCIVGAGIAGLTTAYLLVQEGKSVVLLDDGPIAGGMTAVTTAHLANAIDDRYVEIERLFGQDGARLAAQSHTAAIDRIQAIAVREYIDCDFERLDGYLFLPFGEKEDVLDRELAAAHRAGLANVEKVLRAPLDSFNTGPCLRFPNQGQFHPLKYLAGLARAIDRDGGRIYCKSHAKRIDGGAPARIKVGRREVTADAVVVATNTPVNDLVAIHTKQAPYMTYVIGALVPTGSVAKALYWDTHDPYHYVRLQPYVPTRSTAARPRYDVLIVGGEDHKTAHADDGAQRYARLEAWAHERFPMIREVKFTWSGQVMETVDGLAFIGRNPLDHDNVYIATGDSGMGMTHGTIAGILLTDLILGRENPWASLYDPSRKTLSAAGEFVKENLDVAAQYSDLVTGGAVGSVDEIPLDSGAVIRRGLSKAAVYRDARGGLHERSAICPHLGCVVRWNSTEKTWDCPCHGSRFDKHGKVSNGPSNTDLARIKE